MKHKGKEESKGGRGRQENYKTQRKELNRSFKSFLTIIFKVNGWKKKTQLYFTILILGRVDLKSRRIVRDDRGHLKVVNGIVQQEDLTVLNV